MVRRNGAEVRKERIAEMGRRITKTLEKSGEISLSKTVALCMYDYGLTKDKVMDYITLLAELGLFVLDNEKGKIRKVSETVES